MVFGLGLFFITGGVGWALTALRGDRGRIPETVTGPRGRVEVFTRSPMRILVDLVLVPFGGLMFLFLAVVTLAFAIAYPAIAPMLLGVPAAAFFGVLMLSGAAVTMRRGAPPAMAEGGPERGVAPDGPPPRWGGRVDSHRGLGGGGYDRA